VPGGTLIRPIAHHRLIAAPSCGTPAWRDRRRRTVCQRQAFARARQPTAGQRQKLSRLAMTCLAAAAPVQDLRRGTPNQETRGCGKYGEITMHDCRSGRRTSSRRLSPDLWWTSSATPADTAQYTETTVERAASPSPRAAGSAPPHHEVGGEAGAIIANEKSLPAHLEQRAAVPATPDDTRRSGGIRVAKIWMDLAAILGAKTHAPNTGTAIGRIMPEAETTRRGTEEREVVRLLKKCIESFRSWPSTAKVG